MFLGVLPLVLRFNNGLTDKLLYCFEFILNFWLYHHFDITNIISFTFTIARSEIY